MKATYEYKERLSVTIPCSTNKTIFDLALIEKRSVSNMVSLLLEQAIKERMEYLKI